MCSRRKSNTFTIIDAANPASNTIPTTPKGEWENFMVHCFVHSKAMSDNGEGRTSITIDKQSHKEINEIKPDGIDWEPFLKQAAQAWDEKYGDQWD